MKNRLYKKISVFFLSVILIFVFSCDNGFDSYSDSSSSEPKKTACNVKGYIALSGALPAEVVPATAENSQDRSAVPGIDLTKYHYFVETKKSDNSESHTYDEASSFITASGGTVSFELPLSAGNWSITCGVKNSTTNNIVLSQTLPQSITADETVADLHFVVTPETSGTGEIELTVNAVSPVFRVSAFCDNDAWKSKVSGGVTDLTPGSSGFTLSLTGDDALASGVYEISFTFYDNQNVILYQTTQTVNIIPGMKTNKWVSGSDADGAVITASGFNVSTALMNGFKRTVYYVGNAAGAASADGEGTAYKPFDTLSKALTAIAQTKSATKDYTIHVTGTQTATSAMDTTAKRVYVVPDGIKSLTIVGDSGFESGVPVATINGNSKGTVIEAKSPLILKNVKITGGKNEDGNGGGLYIASGKKVELEKTLIGDVISTTGNAAATSADGNSGNKAKCGAGIYNDGGELILKSGTYISHNYATGDSDKCGGGIYVAASGSVKINDGAKIILNGGNGLGGGLYIAGNGNVEMLSGQISSNNADKGGGIYIDEDANVTMSAGVISGNTAVTSGGAVYAKAAISISGTAKLPYGANASGNPVENQNDVYLDNMQLLVDGPLSGSEVVAALRPNEWLRGKNIIGVVSGTTIESVKDRFKMIDTDFTIKKASSNMAQGILDAPIYVKNYTPADPDSVTGTRDHPYTSLTQAIGTLSNLSEEFAIGIIGEIPAQTIGGTINARALKIQGSTIAANPAINAGGSGSALQVNTTVPVTIENLKITGGSSTNGGGINMASYSTVVLGNGVVIDGNHVTNNGGGIYALYNTKLFMYGTALVGKAGSTPSSEDGASNSAHVAGGGICSYGKVYLGYSALSGDTPVLESGCAPLTGGIKGNYGADNGGGIVLYTENASLVMNSGIISNNNADFGGGISAYAPVTATGGTIEQNVSRDSKGGAVFVMAGTDYGHVNLKIGGSVYIPGGTDNTNDIYLYRSGDVSATLTIADNLTPPDGAATSATVTLANWKRKTNYLSAASETLLNANKGKIALSLDDDGWEKINNTSGTTKYTYIDSPIYVVDATDSGNTRPADFNKGKTSGATGTKSSPYATIAAALGCSELSSASNTITIVGTLIGAQSIASTAADITLTGYVGANETSSSAKLQCYATAPSSAASDGTALTVNTTKKVTIKNLTITGGKKSGNGGGINITAGTVDLASGAVVSGNTATTNGGGVYVASGASLTVSAGSILSNSAASGGAIYNAGTTSLTGTVSIPKGTGSGSNDIALYYDSSAATPGLKPVTVNSSFSTSSDILLTPTIYKRGNTAVSGANATQAGKFKLPETEWSLLTDTGYIGKIDAPIYVAQADACTIAGVSYGGGKTPANGGLGTKAAPYSTIADAVSQCWNGPNDIEGRVINVVGTLLGSQSIGSSITTSTHASALTIKGVDSSAKFHAQGSDIGTIKLGKPLSIQSAVPITLQNLTLMNGYDTSTNGGGIYVKAAGAKLTLGENVTIKANKVKLSGDSLGGGVYIEGTSAAPATLIMKSNATISTNAVKQNTTSSTTKGGGVYLKYANLCMSGNAMIGLKNTISLSYDSTISKVDNTNFAMQGGGVYSDTGSTVWLGYSEPNDSKTAALGDDYGIRWNYGTSAGGGLYNNGGTVKMASGGILSNITMTKGSSDYGMDNVRYGGGLYNNGGTVSLSGGSINRNQSDIGAGIYNTGSSAKIFMTGNIIIGGSGDAAADDSTGNYARRDGGGIYNDGGNLYFGYASSNSDGTPTAATSATTLNGGIRQNYAYYRQSSMLLATNGAHGGGVCSKDGKIYYNTGYINYNGAGLGGGFYLDYNTSGTSLVITGGTMRSNEASVTGGAVFMNSNGTGTTASTIKSSFALSGTTSIESTGIRNNDIYLYYNCSVTVAGALDNGFATRISSQDTNDGVLVLSPNSSSDEDTAYVTNNFKKFTHNTKNVQSNGTLFSKPSVQTMPVSPSSGTYAAASQADFAYIASKVNGGKSLSGVTIVLADDFSISSTYTPIGNANAKRFMGILDGNGKTITLSNTPLNTSGNSAGLIAFAEGATIQNLNLKGTCSINSYYQNCGSIVGMLQGGTIKNCTSSVSITNICTNANMQINVGGIVGTDNNSALTIDNCVYSGTLVGRNTATANAGTSIGGIIGKASSSSTEIRNCINKGSVTGTGWVGGIAGTTSTNQTGILNCINQGPVTLEAGAITDTAKRAVGGIAGNFTGTTNGMSYCVSTGQVTACTGNTAYGMCTSIGSASSCYCYFKKNTAEKRCANQNSTGETDLSVNTYMLNTLNREVDSTKYREWVWDSTKGTYEFKSMD